MAIARFRLGFVVGLALFTHGAMSLHAQVLSPDTVAAESTAVSSETAAENEGGFWSGVKMPKITMPKVSMPKISMPSWPKNEDGIAKSPFSPISSGMSKISSGTKKAWQGTKEIFTFGGDEKNQQVTRRAESDRVSVWDRLRGKPPEPDGPQTVAEWMSQPRVNH